MRYILFFLLPTLAFATCPPESIEVEYRSPITYHKKVTCGYMQDNVIVKHGPETEYNSDDKVVKITEYNRGREGKAAIITPAPATKNLPGVEEATKNEDDDSFAVINELLKVLAYDKSGMNEGQFKVGHCDPKPKEWVIAAVTKKDIPKSYSFNERCDVSGSFTASFTKQFPVSFMLRNLRNFTATAMNVKMDLKKAGLGEIRYRFETENSTVSSPEKTIHFKAYYEVTVDAMTGATKFDTQEGKVTLMIGGDKPKNIERPLVFNK
jgi:hypothetical protein